MTTTDYPAGTIAIATVCGVQGVRVFRRQRTEFKDWAFSPDPDNGIIYSFSTDRGGLVTDIRPLVVIDPEDDAQVAKFAHFSDTMPGLICEEWREFLRDLTPRPITPKPDEPTGLAAVVEDEDGSIWNRDRHGRWRCVSNGLWADWDDIEAVEVLYPGKDTK